MSDLWHLTLNTGHGRRSPRREVADDVVAMLRPVVIAGGGTIRGSPSTSARSRTAGAGSSSAGATSPPDVFAVVCWDERGHAEAWREALEHFRLAPVPTAVAGFSEPPVPWLTVEILVGTTPPVAP